MSRLHVFDLDKTLLVSNCSFAFFTFLVKRGLFSFRHKVSALVGTLRLKFLLTPPGVVHAKLFTKLFQGRPVREITSFIPSFIDEFLTRSLRPSLWQRLEVAKAKKETILLLSNSPSFLVAAIAKKLGIIYWQATEYAKDCKEQFDTIIEMMDGPAKARAVLEFAKMRGFALNQIVAYSDSIDDLPLFELVGEKLAVAPDKRLRSLAQNRGWPILDT